MASHAQALARTGELNAVLEARGFAYGLLARAFVTEPAPDLLRSLAANDAPGLFPFVEESEGLAAGVAELSAYLADPANATDEGYDRLLWDYTRLFLGPAAPPAPPFESVYRSPDRLLFQTETLGVRQAYAVYGLGAARAGAEPEDQLGLELQFLYETCRLAAQAAEEGDLVTVDRVLADQQRFLDEHLLQWAGDFAADVITHAQVGFYRAMARLLAGFLPLDAALLGTLLQEVEPHA